MSEQQQQQQNVPTPLLPMLHVAMKEGEHLDFDPLREFILSNIGEDPAKYSQSIERLSTLRSDALGVSANGTGRDVLYKYYGQLELLELHFHLTDVGLRFHWYYSLIPLPLNLV